MKKLIKNNIIGFILGAIIFSSITAFATIKIQADKVEYSEGVSVKDKIDDLYNIKNTTIDNLSNQLDQKSASYNTLNEEYVTLLTKYNSEKGCQFGSFTCDANCTGSAGKTILNFKPTAFFTTAYNYVGTNLTVGAMYFNLDEDADNFVFYNQVASSHVTIALSSNYSFNNNMAVKNFSSSWLNSTFYYMACK